MEYLNLLVVDDAKSIRDFIKVIMQSVNANITEAEDGLQAYEAIRNSKFDLILMDIQMPGMTGIEVVRKVRNELNDKLTPIIMMTSLAKPELIKKAFDYGASDYISKPLTESELLARLHLRIENRKLEGKLRYAKNRAEQANQAKSDFISMLAHELKTPLSGILGCAELLQASVSDSEHIRYCEHIINAGRHQEDLINEVNNLAKIEAGIIDINLSEVDLAQVVKESYDMTRAMAHDFNVTLNLPHHADVEHMLIVDYKRVKQVFINLVSNAIKYNKPNGEVNISINLPFNGYIEVGVSDTGNGISQEDIPKLFYAFNRLGAEKTEVEGSGIGLPITRKLIELMDGELRVESEEGKGSTFWVKLKISLLAMRRK